MGRLLARCFCVFSAVIWQEMTFVIVFDPGGIPKAAQYVLTCTCQRTRVFLPGDGQSLCVRPFFVVDDAICLFVQHFERPMGDTVGAGRQINRFAILDKKRTTKFSGNLTVSASSLVHPSF